MEVCHGRAQGLDQVLIPARLLTATALLTGDDVLLQGADDDGVGVAFSGRQRLHSVPAVGGGGDREGHNGHDDYRP